jgi:predicted  nucleic acid-binding Zn-ribbon protein
MGLESLKLLESKINSFLAHYEQVRVEKEKLATRLQEKERAYEELVDLLKQYEQERKEIKGRLENILGRFDGLDL